MTFTLNRLLAVIAVVCFAVAWLITAGAVGSGNATAWGYAGFTFFAGSFVP